MRLLMLSLLGAGLVACVPKGKFDEQLAINADLTARLDETEAAKLRLESNVAELSKQLDEAKIALANTSAQAGALQSDVDKMRLALAELEKRKAKADEALAQYRDLVARFKTMIDAGTLRVRVIDGRLVVELATDILFPPGAASLSPDGKKTIASVATVLASIPDRGFQIAGHTDNQPISTEQFPSNWELGSARAITVTRLLVASGLPAHRVSAASYSDTKPTSENETKEGRARNRRIEIVIVPDLSQMPGYEELQRMANQPK